MDSIGSMNSFRDNAASSTRIGKNANVQSGDDPEREVGFGDVLAGLVVPSIVPVQPPVQPPTQQSASYIREATDPSLNQTSSSAPVGQTTPGNMLGGSMLGNEGQGAIAKVDGINAATLAPTLTSTIAVAPTQTATAPATAPASPSASQTPAEGQSQLDGLLASLSDVNLEAQSPAATQSAQDQIKTIQGASPHAMTNAATLSVSRSNAGVAAAAAQSDGAQVGQTDVASQGPSPAIATSTLVSNDNAAAVLLNKTNTPDAGAKIETPNQVLQPVSTTVDGAGTTSVISGQEVSVPANDQANRAPQLTPHNIPTLAATMMRRFESGSKQFTMRLDPPELGQVEVKLTVAPDKKVRAVVSADRPEALADLVRSARDLTRALLEAGLDLEENGLTFQMNDPSTGGQQHQTRDQQKAGNPAALSGPASANEAEVLVKTAKADTQNDPFQRWQRARIALTV